MILNLILILYDIYDILTRHYYHMLVLCSCEYLVLYDFPDEESSATLRWREKAYLYDARKAHYNRYGPHQHGSTQYTIYTQLKLLILIYLYIIKGLR